MVAVQDADLDSGWVWYRPTADEEASVSLRDVTVRPLLAARPSRTFVWYKGQKNYMGSYWSATARHHLVYESRNELAHLLCADFCRSVTRIVTQPFCIYVRIKGRLRHHTPDFLLLDDGAAVVVDVTNPERLHDPKVAFVLTWTAQVMEHLHWRYDVLTTVPSTRLENVRYLAGYRRDWLINPDILAELRSRADDLVGRSLSDVYLASHPDALVRPALLHMLWNQELTVDLDTVLSSTMVLGGPP